MSQEVTANGGRADYRADHVAPGVCRANLDQFHYAIIDGHVKATAESPRRRRHGDTAHLTHLADLLRGHRARIGTRWRKLAPGRQALLVLAHLRNGDTYTRLAGGSRSAWPPCSGTCVRRSTCSPTTPRA
jgi:hypothetical protein